MPFTMTDLVGCEFPLFAFSHCRDVVAAVSRAGSFGVLGTKAFTPAQLETELSWIDDHVGGKPYGVDVLIPEHQLAGAGSGTAEMLELVPPEHWAFVEQLLHSAGIPANSATLRRTDPLGTSLGEQQLEVALRHPIRLMANALGIAPPAMIALGKQHGVPVAALVGAKEHALRQVEAGVDIIVAQGSEAGGHCGEVSTLVLVPEVLRAIRPVRDVPVLAAGGIMTGSQMAGMMAMGAAGAWTGSVWLGTTEAETSDVFKAKMVGARSRDTVRSKHRTGKFSRQLRSAWHDAWEAPSAPKALPMPLMTLVSEPALSLSLALHELATNAAKFGAFLSAGGHVTVNWRLRDDGGLALSWTESGGPVVAPPTRRGFGSSLIEHALALETGGRATIYYRPTGVVCEIVLPKSSLVELDIKPPLKPAPLAGDIDLAAIPERPRVLIVEDSFMVILTLEGMCEELGWDIIGPATRLDAALTLARTESFDAALLDVNLHDEMTWGVADVLRERGIPFVFSTGYDPANMLPDRLAGSVVLAKPYRVEDVERRLRLMMAAGPDVLA